MSIGLCAGRPARASNGTPIRASSTHAHAGAWERMTSAATTTTAHPARMRPRAVRVSFPALWMRKWSDSSPSVAACRSGDVSAGTCHHASSRPAVRVMPTSAHQAVRTR